MVRERLAGPAHTDLRIGRRHTLGRVIRVSADRPSRLIELALPTVAASVLQQTLLGRRIHELPAVARERAVGRGLGRVLAHEIGHYLLALRGHTPAGLMRESFSPDVLTASRGGELTVAPILLPRLRARLAELSEKGGAAPPVTEK
jgi:hypothetical protein